MSGRAVPSRAGRALGALLAALVVLGLVLLAVVNLAAGGTGSPIDSAWPLFMAICAIYGASGAYLVSRMPRNAVGWLMFLVATGLGVSMTSLQYATISFDRFGGSLPATLVLAWLSQWLVVTALTAAVLFMPLLFPTGSLPGPRWRWVAVFALLLVMFGAMEPALMPGPMPDFGGRPNPFGVDALAPVGGILGPLANLLPLLVAPAVLAAPFVRYRRAGTIERLQLRWFALGVVTVFVVILGAIVLPPPLNDLSWVLVWPAMGFLPIAVLFAILRYRLYDIDRIVSRTLGWAIATGAVLLVFGVGLVLLQEALSGLTQGATLAVAASTLAAFAAFQPVRRRVQRAVDRRFDRARYDGERTAAAFGERLRDEVELGTVTGELVSTVGTVLRPAASAVWLREASR